MQIIWDEKIQKNTIIPEDDYEKLVTMRAFREFTKSEYLIGRIGSNIFLDIHIKLNNYNTQRFLDKVNIIKESDKRGS